MLEHLFGKQLPPNLVYHQSQEHSYVEFPTLSSSENPLTAASQLTPEISANNFISFINETFVARKQLFIYLISSAVSKFVSTIGILAPNLLKKDSYFFLYEFFYLR